MFVYFDNSGPPPQQPFKKDMKEAQEMKEHDSTDKGKGKGKRDGSSEDEIDGWSDIDTEEKKRGSPRPRQSLYHRLIHGKLLDGKKQVIFEPKFKEKEVKEILSLLQREQELEGIEAGDGRKYLMMIALSSGVHVPHAHPMTQVP